MAPNGIPHLQLPTFTPLEPLTSGTNLPHVPAEEFAPTELFKESKPPPTPTTTLDASTTPPQSPGRPTSMRRFLSRVSLNSSYTNNGDDDDKASILSGPLSPTVSVMSRDSKRKTSGSGKKTSWWKKSKDKKEDKIQDRSMPPPLSPPPHVIAAPQTTPAHPDERSPETSPHAPARKTVQSIAPPPRLPDDLFGSGFSSLDSDMFKNFK